MALAKVLDYNMVYNDNINGSASEANKSNMAYNKLNVNHSLVLEGLADYVISVTLPADGSVQSN